MTDVSNLDNLAAKIASGKYPNISAYARAQSIATQAQELVIRKLAEEVALLKTKAGGGDGGLPPAPPPPTTLAKPFGYINYSGASPWPTTHLNDYKIILGPYEGANVALHSWKTLRYMAANSCSETPGINYGVTYAQANANGWILADAAGQMRHKSYPTNFLGDLGSAGFRAAWCENVEAMLALNPGVDGFMGDDLAGYVQEQSGGRTPTNYPTDASWYAAMLGFAQYVGAYFKARGKYICWNAGNFKSGDFNSDNAVRTTTMWTDIGPHSDGLMSESWLTHVNSPRADKLRYSAVAWYDYWDEWRSLHSLCTGMGVDLIALHSFHGYSYGLCSFLLDWNGQKGVYMWALGTGVGDYSSDYDPWDSLHSPALALGAPTAAAVKTGNVWTRTYTNGLVTVDPTLGTSSIT